MILVTNFRLRFFYKMQQRIREGRLYMRKIERISFEGIKWMGRAKNVENFHFWIDF